MEGHNFVKKPHVFFGLDVFCLDVLEFCRSVLWQHNSVCGVVLSLCDEVSWLPVVFRSGCVEVFF